MHHILVTFGGYGAGGTSGATRMAWRTTDLLRRRGHRVAVVTDADDALRPEGVEPIGPPPAGWLPGIVHVYDLARPEHADLGHRWARRTRALLAVTPASAPQVWPDPDLGARLLRDADVVFVLTAGQAADAVARGAHPDRLARLPSAPDLEGRPDPEGFRARHGVHGLFVLFLGRRVAEKGYRALVEAAPLVWDRLPEVVFGFAGPPAPGAAGPGLPPDYRLLDLGTPGDREKHDAVSACDVLCLPSRADVFPLVFAEAWACGRPVVSGDFPGVGDVVRDGVDGVVVPPTARGVADGLLGLLTDPVSRRRMGAEGLRRVTGSLSWERAADAVEAGYDRWAGRPAGARPAAGVTGRVTR